MMKLFYLHPKQRTLCVFIVLAMIFGCQFEESYAQTATRVVSGNVVNDMGEPMLGVTIVVKGSNTGTTTSQNGQFSLPVKSDDIVTFSYIGYKTQELPASGIDNSDIVLYEDNTQMGEVVVTALGIRKDKQKIGYSVQEVSGAEFEKAKEVDLASSLTGKVAGLSVVNRSTMFERSEMMLRGGSVLIVVDGVPVNSDTYSLASDDIENITVLKGTAAAALYGSLGINGAMMITTKKGKPGANGVEISVNSTNQFQAGFLRFPETQTEYGMGWNGQYAFVDGKGGGINDNYGYVWGPKLNVKDASTPSGYREITQFNSPVDPETGQRIPIPWITRSQSNMKDFLRNEFMTTNNISVASKFDKGEYRISLSNTYQRGQVPNTKMSSTTFSVAGNLKLSDKVNIGGNISYNNLNSPNYSISGYGPDNYVYNIALWMGPDVNINDLRDYWDPGMQDRQQRSYNYTWYNNPWYLANEKIRSYDAGAVIAQVNGTIDFTDDLTLMLRSGVSTNDIQREIKTPWSYIGYGGGSMPYGGYSITNQNNMRMVSDALLTYDKQFGDFSLTATAGASLRYERDKMLNSNTVGGLSIPGHYALSNSMLQSETNNDLAESQVSSLMALVEMSYKGIIYLNLTGRNDWSSKLQPGNNSYFYPSASLGLVVSNMFKMPSWLTYLKLRGAVAMISSDNISIGGVRSEYATLPVYGSDIRWTGLPSLSLPGVLISPDLKPNKTTSQEYGFDLRLADNRIGLDFTYYTYLEHNKIIQVGMSNGTGYSSQIVNGDKVQRRGVEVMLNTVPVRTKDFQWTLNANYHHFRQIQKEFYGGEEMRDFVKVGGRTDVLVGKKFDTSNGGDVIYAGGFPQAIPGSPNTVLGYVNPDWEFAIGNHFKYRDFSFSFQIDGRIGGTVINGIEKKLWEGGMHPDSANSFRDDSYEGNATYVGKGVEVTGGTVEYDAFGNKVHDDRTFKPNDTAVKYVDWVFSYYTKPELSPVLYDGTFVKLREVVLTYDLPQGLLQKTFIKQASISFVGRNLLMFAKVPYMDPDGGSYAGRDPNSIVEPSYALTDPSYRNLGFNVSLKF